MTHDRPLICSGQNLTLGYAPLCGGKAANLVSLDRSGQPVPHFYVVTTEAFRTALIAAGVHERMAARLDQIAPQSVSSLRKAAAEIQGWIRAVSLPLDLVGAILQADAQRSQRDAFVAIRPSVTDEDSAGHSSAGLHGSFLFVRGQKALVDAIKNVWASAFSERTLASRLEQSLPLMTGVAVVVQEMVHARTSGVMFTANPATGSVDEVIIHSLFGAGEGLVAAGLEADCYTIDKETLAVASEVARKQEQYLIDEAAENGLRRVALPDSLRNEGSLTEKQVRTLAGAGMEIERHFGRPQDVEFAIDGDGNYSILQARAVTTVAEYGPAAGNHLIWDNSNIIESYSGVTSPMTFSFNRRAYAIVSQQFAEVMGISPRVIRKNRRTFENLLGFFHGRVYYNLLNWHRLIRLFPGFGRHKQFLESMMELTEPLELCDEADSSGSPGLLRLYLLKLPALIWLLLRSTWNFLTIRRIVDRFNERFESNDTHWRALDFRTMVPHQLMAQFRKMEDMMLWNWKAPIINDFFVIICCGVMKKLCERWCGDVSGSLRNDLLCGIGRVASVGPVRKLLSLAEMAAQDPVLKERILNDPPERLVAEIPNDPRFTQFTLAFDRYLEAYGARCMNELKLEVYSLKDRPHFLYRRIHNYLQLDDPAALDVAAIEKLRQRIRAAAESRAFEALQKSRGTAVKSCVFRWVLEGSRLGVRNREKMRFTRTRIFDLLRDLIRALGSRLADEGILDDSEDIFFLTLDEVWDYIHGTALTTDIRGLAALRQKEFEAYRNEEQAAPDDRFETYGMTYHRNLLKNRSRRAAPAAPVDGILRGTACCSGKATGPVKVLRTPSDDTRLCGEILVVERTDPGCVPLYPMVSGILIERGSTLSYSAIVAREMGIPTIIGIPGLLNTLKTGDEVCMDGSEGTVEVLHIESS